MIKKDKVVSMNYRLKNAEGKEMDKSEEPFSYLQGAGQIVRGLETALEGLKTGDKKQVVVSPKEGYGERNPKLKVQVDRAAFPADVNVEPGLQFQAENNGEVAVFTIDSVEGNQVTLDGNHPLAGETLHFDVEILEVRDATKNELEHGHVHGPGGHHH